MAIEFKLAPLFGSGAVLCRRKEVRVWGTAADGQTVTGRVTTADGLILSEGICTARDGRFLLLLRKHALGIADLLRVGRVVKGAPDRTCARCPRRRSRGRPSSRRAATAG